MAKKKQFILDELNEVEENNQVLEEEKARKNLQINKELKALIPPLAKEEFEQLESNIITQGCRDALVVWKNNQDYILLDGHNRYQICTKNKIDFKLEIKTDIKNLNQAKEWMIINQFGRRNLLPYQRAKLALELKGIFEKEAKKRMKGGNPVPKSEQGRTIEKIGEVAKMGKDSLYKVEKIEKEASQEIKNQLNKGDISINKAFNQIKNIKSNKPKESTLLKNKEYTEAINKIANTTKSEKESRQLKEKILNKDIDIPKKKVEQIAKLPEEKIKEVVKNIQTLGVSEGLKDLDNLNQIKKELINAVQNFYGSEEELKTLNSKIAALKKFTSKKS